MRWRLSDHDEWAMWRLADFCAAGRSADRLPHLGSVVVHDGWATASDSYRLLSLPVEADVSGTVSRFDAMVGGTVPVAPLDEVGGRPWLPVDRLTAWIGVPGRPIGFDLGRRDADALARRPVVSARAPRTGKAWPVVSIWPSGFDRAGVIGPDGATLASSWAVVRTDGLTAPTVVQPRWLGRAAVAVAEAIGADWVTVTGDHRSLTVAGPVDKPDGWLDGWAVVACIWVNSIPVPAWVGDPS